MRHSLTNNQTRVLQFIRKCLKEKQEAPTYAEISEAVGIKSKSQVHRTVHALKTRGYVELLPALPRGITLLPEDDGDEIRQLRQIRDAANAYVHLQEKFREAYELDASSEEAQKGGARVTSALTNLSELVRG